MKNTDKMLKGLHNWVQNKTIITEINNGMYITEIYTSFCLANNLSEGNLSKIHFAKLLNTTLKSLNIVVEKRKKKKGCQCYGLKIINDKPSCVKGNTKIWIIEELNDFLLIPVILEVNFIFNFYMYIFLSS